MGIRLSGCGLFLQLMVFGLAVFEEGDILKPALTQQVAALFEPCADIGQAVGIAADGYQLAAEGAVEL